MDGEHRAVICGEHIQNINVLHVLAPLQGHVQRLAPVKLHGKVALLLGLGVVLVGEQQAQIRRTRPGDHGLEDFGMLSGGQQRVGAALAPAHHADMIAIDVLLRGHVLGGGHSVGHGALKGVAGVIGGGIAVAHEIDADGGDAVLLGQHGRCVGVAAAGLIAVGAGAVQHYDGGVDALCGGHADGRGNLVIARIDGNDGLNVAGGLGKGGGGDAQDEYEHDNKALLHMVQPLFRYCAANAVQVNYTSSSLLRQRTAPPCAASQGRLHVDGLIEVLMKYVLIYFHNLL